MRTIQTRRDFTTTLALAGAGALLPGAPALADEGPPETTTVRFSKIPGICIAPQYVADELLRAEGFTDLRYVPVEAGPGTTAALGRGEIDFAVSFVALYVAALDGRTMLDVVKANPGGAPIRILAGIHSGCFELFTRDSVQRVTDLKGKSIGVRGLGSTPHLFLASIATYVGLDPRVDVNWVTTGSANPMQLFVDGKIDAFLGFPPEPQELRAREIGRVILDSGLDRPWSQYFCCLLAGHADFVRAHPVATKRVTRAILKAADLCASEPKRAAQRLVERGFTASYDYALQTMDELPYGKWREYDPEDTIRFYALRLHEAGMIKSSPKRIVENGTDWRFLEELKRELKA